MTMVNVKNKIIQKSFFNQSAWCNFAMCNSAYMEQKGVKQSILFLVNPQSGVSKKKRVPQMVERYIDPER